jgi:Uma2 family endonuclease
MATTTAGYVSVERYLRTVYRPDREHVDGVVERRNLGERDHSDVQGNLIAFFRARYRHTGITAWPDWRFQTRATRFRVPDVLVTRGKPDEQILITVPLLCIEILSPKDRVSRVNERIKEYFQFGVPVVWLIDPTAQRLWIYRPDLSIVEATGSVKLDATSIEVPFSEIFD